jgi:hypothetical protein
MRNVIEGGRVSEPFRSSIFPAKSRYDATFWSIDAEPQSRTILILNPLQYNERTAHQEISIS